MAGRPWLLSAALLAIASLSLIVAWLAQADRHTASALTPANVGFAPPSSTLVLGATPVPTVDVSVTNVSGLGGYDAWVTFNPSVVQLNGLQDSGFLGNPNPQGTPQNPVLCNTPTITAGYGHLTCSILPLPPPFPAPVLPSAGSTPAPLIHASFSPLVAGTSPLGLTAVVNSTPETTTLMDVNSTPLAASLGAGSITVNSVSPAVGGIAEEPAIAALPPRAASSHLPRDLWLAFGLAAGAAALLIMSVGWVRRRRA
ncbi:MAG: hypothetical protein ACYDEB_07595 [Dehalococcoidia bacterium]